MHTDSRRTSGPVNIDMEDTDSDGALMSHNEYEVNECDVTRRSRRNRLGISDHESQGIEITPPNRLRMRTKMSI